MLHEDVVRRPGWRNDMLEEMATGIRFASDSAIFAHGEQWSLACAKVVYDYAPKLLALAEAVEAADLRNIVAELLEYGRPIAATQVSRIEIAFAALEG